MFFNSEGVSSKLLKVTLNSENKEYILEELNLCKRKWLITCVYNPHTTTKSSHLEDVGKENVSPASQYENVIVIKESNCFKNFEKPTIIDLFLTNKPKRFQLSSTFETGISDFHKMALIVLKALYTA